MAQGQIQALVLCGPSGSGKSTLLRRLFKEYPDKFGFSISHTTRNPRPLEKDGIDYHFTTKPEMEAAIRNGEFIESATFANNLYGTSKKAVKDVMQNGKICVLDIDVQGVKQMKKTDIKTLYVFVKPPSIDVLVERLKRRGTETEETLEKRIKAAKEEIEYGETPNNFDLILKNEDLDETYEELKKYVVEQVTKHGGEESACVVEYLRELTLKTSDLYICHRKIG